MCAGVWGWGEVERRPAYLKQRDSVVGKEAEALASILLAIRGH